MMGHDSHNFEISVIVPVYNTEDYLEEAIESIVGQSIGFERIQLILVNDGSTDSSGTICRKFAEAYPDNVISIDKPNGGVSSACNEGLSRATGKYVNFFGSDDRWDEHALATACSFMDDHFDEIDVVACRLVFFGIKAGRTHPLDYRFQDEEDKIVDLQDQYWFGQMMSGNCVFKRSSLAGKSFDESLNYAEDAMMVCTVLLVKQKYGVLSSAIYHYRKRGDNSALSSQAELKKDRYIDCPQRFIQRIMELSKKRYGKVPMFIQYIVMYETQWIVKRELPDNLSDEEKNSYIAFVKELLKDVDIPVIRKLKSLKWEQKVFLMQQKGYGENCNAFTIEKKRLRFMGELVAKLVTNRSFARIHILDVVNDRIRIEGITHVGVLGDSARLAIKLSNGNLIYPKCYVCKPYVAQSYLGPVSGTGIRFVFDFLLSDISSFSFCITGVGEGVHAVRAACMIHAKLTDQIDESFYSTGKYIIRLHNNMRFDVRAYSVIRDLVYERRFQKAIYANDGLIKRDIDPKKIIAYRKKARISRIFHRKPIWILSDRFSKAGDNGENLFKYLSEINASEKYDVYFLYESQYSDYERLCQYGKVIDPRNDQYKVLLLNADKIISAHADATVTNPFGFAGYALSNLMRFDYVYLQHGVMPGNLSSWLNKLNKNAKLITTTAYREREQLLDDSYAYSEEDIVLTGMTRHDALGITAVEKLIIFLPTWRSTLAGKADLFERRRDYVDEFFETEYCRFYNQLINDERLTTAMKRYGYKGEFYVHPSFEKQASDFHGNDVITVGANLADYESILNRAALMVTDYSSVAFDFGIQGKPVIYSQFDSEDYWSMHFYDKGYFDYETDGFGPVCYDLSSCVDALVSMMENECKMPEEYARRGEEFFAFHDHSNSQRVFKAICAIDERKS